MSTDNKNLSVVNCFFWTEGHKGKRGYGNRMFGRNKSYVLMFFCLKIIKICLSRTVFWTKGHKDNMEDLAEAVLLSVNIISGGLFVFVFVFFFVFRGGQSGCLLEGDTEITLVAESGLFGNFQNRQVRLFQ